MTKNEYTIDYNLAKNIPLPLKSYKNLSDSNIFTVKNSFSYDENTQTLYLNSTIQEELYSNKFNSEISKDEFFNSLKEIIDYESELRIHETVFYDKAYSKNEEQIKKYFKDNNFIICSIGSKISFDNGIGFIKNNKTNEFLSFFHSFSLQNPPIFYAQIKDFYPLKVQNDIISEINERRYNNTKYDYYFYNIDENQFYQMHVTSNPNVKSDIYSTSISYNSFLLKIVEDIFDNSDKEILKKIFELNKTEEDKELLNETRAFFIENKNKNFKDLEKIKKYSDIEF